jgi:ArsR family transcriptional regulator, arsenate/arsenite/antimonite-responsive transcriptional repressor
MEKLELASVTCCAPGAPPLKPSEFEALSARFKALADPTRLAIVNRLASRGDACVCEFNTLGLSQPTISHHLRVLREAGLIEVAYKRKTWVFYRLVPEAVEALAFALGGSPQPEFVLATAEGTVAR